MRRELEIANARLVFTQNELGYAEVLEDFECAEYIFIVTYNISTSNNFLLDKLREVSENTEVKIFTNIPNRFDNYYGEQVRVNANKRINNYITRLNPQEFTKMFSSFFIFNNHSKIVMTNNIAYVGSANYSSESANNIESGIVFRDTQAIQRLRDIINKDLQPQAHSYYMIDFLPLLFFVREIEELRIILSDSVWGTWEFQGREMGEYYKGSNIELDIEIVETFNEVREQIVEVLADIISELDSDIIQKQIEIGVELVEKLNDIKDMLQSYVLEQEVIDFLEFDSHKYTNDLMQENAIFMTEDVLDDYVEGFTNNAFEIKDELASVAFEGFIEFEKFLKNIILGLSDNINELQLLINPNIDNTI